MGDMKDTLRVGKPIGRMKGLPPMEGTIVDPDRFAMWKGKKVKGEMFVNAEGMFLQGSTTALAMKRSLVRLNLVRWSDVRRIEIDGHSYERIRGRSAFGFGAGGMGAGRIMGSHRAAQANLILTTDKEQLAYSLPIDPVALRNLLGKVIVDIEHSTEAETKDDPPPV